MSKGWLLSLIAVTASAPASGAEAHYRAVDRPLSDFYFGHISYCELKGDRLDPLVERGERTEPATLNQPLVPGDRIRSGPGRRCEAQFDTGSVMRLDGESVVRIETVLAPALSSGDKLTNLQLEAGRVRVLYRDYDRDEVFQVLTPNAALKLERAAVVDVEIGAAGETRVTVERGRAALLYGPRAEKTRTKKLKSGERVTVGVEDTLLATAAAGDAADAFSTWNREMDESFVERHQGKSALPKPILRYPRAVVDFALRFADPYGEWIWSDLYGYAWRPYLGQDEGWRPYLQGRWVPVGGRMFWVPEEPWGWVPYHLGLWHWDAKHGWIWIPGSAFAPAWVAWSLCADASYFSPFGLWDWSRAFARGGRMGALWATAPCGLQARQPTSQTVELGGAVPQPTASPIPAGDDGETRPIRWRGDRPFPELPEDASDLAGALKRLRSGELPPQDPPGLPAVEATPAGTIDPPRPALEGAPERFRDWNADVRAARSVGGRIVYSSLDNAVACEDCRRPLVRLNPRFGGDSGNASSNGSSQASEAGSAGSGAAAPGGAPAAAPRAESSDRERIRD